MVSRRRLVGALAAVPFAGRAAGAVRDAARDDRILVVVELSGGNDGLNTVVPHGDDAYYRARPGLGIRRDALLPLDDHFGFNPGAVGLQRLWQRGELAIVHGCGYDDPSYSHFTSMNFWHTGAPNSGRRDGWLGRLADQLAPAAPPNFIVNIGAAQSLAVRSNRHVPVVFDDPQRFGRRALASQRDALETIPDGAAANASAQFLRDVARGGRAAAAEIRAAWRDYKTPVDYGLAPLDLPKVAACIASGFPARVYYVSFRNNAFDTHVQQAALHRRLLSYAADAIHAFVRDLDRQGLGERVTLLAFSEFGRRVGENANRGTDHGSANLMLVAGSAVRGGHYGRPPDLEDLDGTDNLRHTTDFRRVYATAAGPWLGATPGAILGTGFEPLDLFA
ncbi:MAG: DUF1501 domain-containing protein [Pseudomonadota bacterium]